MKVSVLLVIVLILLFVLLGCDNTEGVPANSQTDDNSSVETITTEIIEQTTAPEYNNVDIPFEGELNIYDISREVFFEFIENPSIEILNTKNGGVHSCPSEGVEIFNGSVMFTIDQSFEEFVDIQSIQSYLSGNGYNVTVESVSVFWESSLFVCIWIKTIEDDFVITVNELTDDWFSDEPYVYRLYTEGEFRDKYSRKEGKAIINGKELPEEAIVYIYHDYAEVPFLASLECYGANTISNDGNIAKFSFNGEVYCLNIRQYELYKEGKENANFFPALAGGTNYVYSNGNDVMVDDMVFRCIVEDIIIGEFPEKNIDRDNNLVEIG